MVVNSLYYGENDNSISPSSLSSPIVISPDIIATALRNIYQRDFNPTEDIEPAMFNAIAATLTKAVNTAAPSLGEDPMIDALRHSADVFAAFKVHRAQNDMAALLIDSNGNLKPFEQWKNEVLPIASHQCGSWLETEYNTAVLRARQAANWQQFQREKDVLPNLKWLPSTSPNPGADHRPFWNTILPIDHPFWNQHRPGDRWNCKCDLTSTDEPITPVPQNSHKGNISQPGLDNNPGKDGQIFSRNHPYVKKAHPGAKKAVNKLMQRIQDMIDEMPDNLTEEEKKAIAKNNLEIEKALGMTKGKPMTVDEADKQNANPKHNNQFVLDPNGPYRDKAGNRYIKNKHYDKKRDEPYNINCQTCAPAYALRLKGFKISAKGNIPNSQLEYLSKGRAFEVWKNADGTPAQHTSINSWLRAKRYQKMTPKRYYEFFNETCKDEGVYELCIGWKGGSGHATILQRFKNGELRYIEPQNDNSKGSGQEWKDVKYLCNLGAANSHDCRGIMRIDNKLFDIKFACIFDI